jgi:hypothetical protein
VPPAFVWVTEIVVGFADTMIGVVYVPPTVQTIVIGFGVRTAEARVTVAPASQVPLAVPAVADSELWEDRKRRLAMTIGALRVRVSVEDLVHEEDVSNPRLKPMAPCR